MLEPKSVVGMDPVDSKRDSATSSVRRTPAVSAENVVVQVDDQ
jgi:hypothetical protein